MKNGVNKFCLIQSILQNSHNYFYIVSAAMAITYERSQVISFLRPITTTYYELFIKNPHDSYNYWAFVEPLKMTAWIMPLTLTLIAPIGVSLVFW
jgi:hypothetical protein